MADRSDNKQIILKLDQIHRDLDEGIVLSAGDLEIGAVEIKNSSDDTRATVNASNELLVKDTTADTSLSVIDDWDETDRAKVNIIVGQAGIAAGTGVDGATVPRVTLATNVALPAGTNAIGKLAANSGVDIGDTDVLSIISGTGATNLGKAEDAAHTSGDVGVEMLGVRNDANAVLSDTDLDYTSFATDSAGRIKSAQTVATVSQSITRPADAAPYTAGDVIATTTGDPAPDSTLSFANAVKENNEVGTVIGAMLIDSVNAATKGDFDLELYDTAPANQNDNDAYAPTDAERNTCLGVIQFLGADARTSSNNAVYEGFLQNPITIVGLSGASNIIGVLIVRNAYTPASGEVFKIRLRIEQY